MRSSLARPNVPEDCDLRRLRWRARGDLGSDIMRGLDSRDGRRDAGMEDDLMVTIIGLDSRDGRRDAGMASSGEFGGTRVVDTSEFGAVETESTQTVWEAEHFVLPVKKALGGAGTHRDWGETEPVELLATD